MIILLSPAKTLDYETPINDVSHSIPSFLTKSKDLIKTLKDKKPEEISKLMKKKSTFWGVRKKVHEFRGGARFYFFAFFPLIKRVLTSRI